jgi:hypothetical protein
MMIAGTVALEQGGEGTKQTAISEIDVLYEEMKKNGVFETPGKHTQPENTDYSQFRQFNVVDPDGKPRS